MNAYAKELEALVDEMIQICDVFMNTEESLQRSFGSGATDTRDKALARYNEIKKTAFLRNQFNSMKALIKSTA